MQDTGAVPLHRTDDVDEIEDVVFRTFALVQRVVAHFHSCAAELGLTAAEATALVYAQPGEGVAMTELAQRCGVDPANLTRTVNRLHGRGLVDRSGAQDRRIRGVWLTPAGLRLRQQLRARATADNPAVIGLSPAQRRNFRDVLEKLETTHGSRPG